MICANGCGFKYSYTKENRERRERKQDYKYEGKTEEEVLEMGDES